MCKNSTSPHLHYMYSFFSIHFSYQFLWLYIKNRIFYKFVLFVKVTQHRNAFLMSFDMWFFIFFHRAETVHDNHQCSYWEHLVHIYAIFQYTIILEMIICNSWVTLFVSWFHYAFVLSIFITGDEKHFCQICISSNMSKNYTHNKNAHFMWFFMWYVCQICTFFTSANNTEMHFWCYLSCFH